MEIEQRLVGCGSTKRNYNQGGRDPERIGGSMKGLFQLLTIFVLLIMSSGAFAGWTSEYGTIEEVISHNGYHLIKTNIPSVTCGGNGNFWWPANDPDAKDMLAIALAAFMSGKKLV